MFTIEEITNKVYHGDCLEIMKSIPDQSISLICCDLPYDGVTHNAWDELIPFDQLWAHYNRIIKPNGAILLFANGTFTYKVMASNPKNFKYKYIWLKNNATNFANAKRQPMRRFEEILVFYTKQPVYNPQGLKPVTRNRERYNEKMGDSFRCKSLQTNYIQEFENYPGDVLKFDRDKGKSPHPTAKPVKLLEHLLLTHSNEKDIVLDNCAGALSLGVACENTGRNFILIEKEEKYIKVGMERLNNKNIILK